MEVLKGVGVFLGSLLGISSSGQTEQQLSEINTQLEAEQKKNKTQAIALWTLAAGLLGTLIYLIVKK